MIIKKSEQGNHIWEFVDDKTRNSELILIFPESGCLALAGQIAQTRLYLLEAANITQVYNEKMEDIISDIDSILTFFDISVTMFLDLADKTATSLANMIMLEMEIVKICEENNESKSEKLIKTTSQNIENLNLLKSKHQEIKGDIESTIKTIQSNHKAFEDLVSSIYKSVDARNIYENILVGCSIQLNTYIEYQQKIQELEVIERKTYSTMFKKVQETKNEINGKEANGAQTNQIQRSTAIVKSELTVEQIEHKKAVDTCLALIKPPEWKLPYELISLIKKNLPETVSQIASRVAVMVTAAESSLEDIKLFEESIEDTQPIIKIMAETAYTLNMDLNRDMKLDYLDHRSKSLTTQCDQLELCNQGRSTNFLYSFSTYLLKDDLANTEMYSKAIDVLNIYKPTSYKDKNSLESIKIKIIVDLEMVKNVVQKSRQCDSVARQQKALYLDTKSKIVKIHRAVSQMIETRARNRLIIASTSGSSAAPAAEIKSQTPTTLEISNRNMLFVASSNYMKDSDVMENLLAEFKFDTKLYSDQWKLSNRLLELVQTSPSTMIEQIALYSEILIKTSQENLNQIKLFEESIEKVQPILSIASEKTNDMNKKIQSPTASFKELEFQFQSLSKLFEQLKSSIEERKINSLENLPTYSENSDVTDYKVLKHVIEIFVNELWQTLSSVDGINLEALKIKLSIQMEKVRNIGERNRRCAAVIQLERKFYLDAKNKFEKTRDAFFRLKAKESAYPAQRQQTVSEEEMLFDEPEPGIENFIVKKEPNPKSTRSHIPIPVALQPIKQVVDAKKSSTTIVEYNRLVLFPAAQPKTNDVDTKQEWQNSVRDALQNTFESVGIVLLRKLVRLETKMNPGKEYVLMRAREAAIKFAEHQNHLDKLRLENKYKKRIYTSIHTTQYNLYDVYCDELRIADKPSTLQTLYPQYFASEEESACCVLQ